MVSGGEPFIYPNLFEIAEKHNDMAFMIYTNGILRTNRPFILMDFWNDGEYTQGCIAGGRSYFHITPSGDVAPCAFSQFTNYNIKDKSLVEVLKSPLFKAYQKRQPFCKNHLRPCPVIYNPDALKEIVKESGARPLYLGAEAIISEDTNKILNEKAKKLAEISDAIAQRDLKNKNKSDIFEEKTSKNIEVDYSR